MKTKIFTLLTALFALILCFSSCESTPPSTEQPQNTEATQVTTEATQAHTHTEVVDEAIAPTCTDAGKTEGKHCSVCNTVIVAQAEVAAIGHTEVTDKGFPATESTTGLT
ncbi:MAG: hypothetical protein IIW21_08310, partial [Clostridia bacterium]|nr:hypothetical protein [Clostridia bacterium]